MYVVEANESLSQVRSCNYCFKRGLQHSRIHFYLSVNMKNNLNYNKLPSALSELKVALKTLNVAAVATSVDSIVSVQTKVRGLLKL